MTALLEDTSSQNYDKWGSLVTAVSPAKLEKNQTPRAVNVLPDEKPGSIVTVPGWTRIGTLPSGSPSRFLYTFQKSDGTSVVLCSDNATVYTTSDFVSFTSIITGLSSSFQLRAITVRNKVWLTNGNDAVRTFDGSSVVALDGSGTTPNVPKGKFIEFWQERIWVGDISDSRSSTRFTALTDSSGNDIAPDNANAWPTSNEIEYGEDDGDVVCGLKVYRTVLHVFKGKTIYRLDGQDEYTYSPTKITFTTGCRTQESIQERDELLEFIGKDGVYEFDGFRTNKVSYEVESVDLTQFSFNNIQQSSSQQKSRLWTTQADFTGCTLTKLSATRVPNEVIVDSFSYQATATPEDDVDNPWTAAGTGSDSVASNVLTVSGTAQGVNAGQGTHTVGRFFTRNEPGLSNANGTRVAMYAKISSGDANGNISLVILDGTQRAALSITTTQVLVADNNGGSASYNLTTSDYHLYEFEVQGSTFKVYVDGTLQITYTSTQTFYPSVTSSIQWSASVNGGNAGTGTSHSITALFQYVNVVLFTTTGSQIISDVQHITDTISSWGAFQADYATNGGTLTFYLRSGTTSIACTSASWVAVTPGTTISVPLSNVFVQWRCDFTFVNETSPELEDVQINWNVSSGTVTTTQGVASIVYKNRYWLTGAFAGSSFNNALIVRGKRVYGTPWIQLTQFNIVAFCVFNEQLYAAASDSAGLLRLDTGYNANGAALLSSWETRDEVGGADEIFSKRWPVIIIAGERNGPYNLTVDVSTDGGVTFPSTNTRTISLAGSGRFIAELRYKSLRAKQIRVRVSTNGVDQPFSVESIQIFWRKSFLR